VQCEYFKVLRPLVMVLKCMLKQRSLHEVFHGGLGSWSLTNMAIAHLQVIRGLGGSLSVECAASCLVVLLIDGLAAEFCMMIERLPAAYVTIMP
jgi:DNA polymerase sigma